MSKHNFKIGYHASHEQFAPSALVTYCQQAEAAGFDLIMSSDHLNPWSVTQGHSGFNWAWLAAALGATRNIPFGTMCIPGGWRYHPVIAAQAMATIAELYPGRLHWLAAGSGQAMNERVVQPEWPGKAERNLRTRKGVEMMRALWNGDTIVASADTHYAHHAKIWSLPDKYPAIIGAALSPETAAYMAGWTEGLITVYTEESKLQEIVDAYNVAGGSMDNLCIQVHISWHEDIDEAKRNSWIHWRNNLVPAPLAEDAATVAELEYLGRSTTQEQATAAVVCGSDSNIFVDLIMRLETLGFNTIIIHNVGLNQGAFIEMFKRSVLPFFC